MHNDTAAARHERATAAPAVIDDCLEAIWSIAVESGLSDRRAADVCLITLLRLLDEGRLHSMPGDATAQAVVSTAVEECRLAWQLSAWHDADERGRHLMAVPTVRGGRS